MAAAVEVAGHLAPRPRGRGRVGPVVLLGPAFACLALFVGFPIAATVVLSFFRYNAFTREVTWAGLEYWAELLAGGELWPAFLHTVGYAAVVVPVQVGGGLLLALLVNAVRRGGTLWRTLLFAPAACTLAATGVAWRWIFYPDAGVFDQTVGRLAGVTNWLSTPGFALVAVALVGAWFGVGESMILFLAGLTGVSASATDAARVDGANAWHRFAAVTWPALGPAALFATVVATADSLRVFDQVRVMTGGGPAGASTTLSYLQYTIGIESFDIGRGSVVSLLILALVLVAIGVQLRLAGRRVDRAVTR